AGGVLPEVNRDRRVGADLRVRAGEPIEILFDFCVAIGIENHGIVGAEVGTVGLFPEIGHAIAIGVELGYTAIDDAVAVVTKAGLGLAGIKASVGPGSARAGAG